MFPFEDRYTRQRQVRGVGAEGQRRFQALRATVSLGPEGDVEAAYLVRAGVQVSRGAPLPTTPFPHARYFAHTGPATFASGAHRALMTLKQALGRSEGT